MEGGSKLNAGFLRENLVNQVYLYVAPSFLGGQDAQGLIGGLSPKHLSGKVAISNVRIQFLGDDFLVMGDLNSLR